ncbi:MerR family DNA-binding transcriptional regulator [Pseudocalidococcus azoricus]|nr:MerR family DNA-binding transcriptional regulator [Pseudocalidococcus azoricus]
MTKQSGVSVPTLRYDETLQLIAPPERGENGYPSIWMIIEQNA